MHWNRNSKRFQIVVIAGLLALSMAAVPAASEQFSIKCYSERAAPSHDNFFTFDTESGKIVYESLSGFRYKGRITTRDTDNLQFSVYAGGTRSFDLRWDEKVKELTWFGIPGDDSRPTLIASCQRVPLRPTLPDYDNMGGPPYDP